MGRAATRGSCFAAARAACVSTWLGKGRVILPRQRFIYLSYMCMKAQQPRASCFKLLSSQENCFHCNRQTVAWSVCYRAQRASDQANRQFCTDLTGLRGSFLRFPPIPPITIKPRVKFRSPGKLTRRLKFAKCNANAYSAFHSHAPHRARTIIGTLWVSEAIRSNFLFLCIAVSAPAHISYWFDNLQSLQRQLLSVMLDLIFLHGLLRCAHYAWPVTHSMHLRCSLFVSLCERRERTTGLF